MGTAPATVRTIVRAHRGRLLSAVRLLTTATAQVHRRRSHDAAVALASPATNGQVGRARRSWDTTASHWEGPDAHRLLAYCRQQHRGFPRCRAATESADDSIAPPRPRSLLADAERAGGLTPSTACQTRDALQELARGADAELLTCSILGPCIAAVSTPSAVPTLRVDAALADEATRGGGNVIALCAIETTVGPTTQVFADAAKRSAAQVEVRLVPGAWARFRAGDRAGYLAAIAAAADKAYASGASVVALA